MGKNLPPGYTLTPNRKRTFNQGSSVLKGYDVFDPQGELVAAGTLKWDKTDPSMGEFRASRVNGGRILDEGHFSGFMASRLGEVVRDWLSNLSAPEGTVSRVSSLRRILAEEGLL